MTTYGGRAPEWVHVGDDRVTAIRRLSWWLTGVAMVALVFMVVSITQTCQSLPGTSDDSVVPAMCFNELVLQFISGPVVLREVRKRVQNGYVDRRWGKRSVVVTAVFTAASWILGVGATTLATAAAGGGFQIELFLATVLASAVITATGGLCWVWLVPVGEPVRPRVTTPVRARHPDMLYVGDERVDSIRRGSWWLTGVAGAALVLMMASILQIYPTLLASRFTSILTGLWSLELLLLFVEPPLALRAVRRLARNGYVDRRRGKRLVAGTAAVALVWWILSIVTPSLVIVASGRFQPELFVATMLASAVVTTTSSRCWGWLVQIREPVDLLGPDGFSGRNVSPVVRRAG